MWVRGIFLYYSYVCRAKTMRLRTRAAERARIDLRVILLSPGGQVLKGRSANVMEDRLGGHDGMMFCVRKY